MIQLELNFCAFFLAFLKYLEVTKVCLETLAPRLSKVRARSIYNICPKKVYYSFVVFSLAFSIVLVYIESFTAELENVTFMREIALNIMCSWIC